eukprot:1261840-Karenia_brevis.AAC.1
MKQYQAARIAAKATGKAGGPPPTDGSGGNNGTGGKKQKGAGGKGQPQQPSANRQPELKPPEVINSIQEAAPKA